MKKITAFYILVILISFTSCNTYTKYAITVSVDREPTLTIINRTGFTVAITAPVSRNTANGASTLFQPTATPRSIDVAYRIEQFQFTEQVAWNNTDVTVTLTKRPPSLTVINQTGYSVSVTAPSSVNIANEASTNFLLQPTETSRSIEVAYRIGQIQFTEQVTVNNTDVAVTLKKPPTVTVVNQIGRPVVVTTPITSQLQNGEKTQFPSALNQRIDITYRSGLMQLIEQATVTNQDITVTLTRGAPTLTIVNNVGATIITIFLRVPNTPEWIGGNIVTKNGEVSLRSGASTTELTGSIVNKDSMRIWMGNIPISGDRFDIRIDDVQGNTYVKSNVQIRNDATITFTQNDKR